MTPMNEPCQMCVAAHPKSDCVDVGCCHDCVPSSVNVPRELVEAAKHRYKGPNDTDASMLREAAKRIEGGYEAGGSNTKATVARVLKSVAALLDAAERSDEGEFTNCTTPGCDGDARYAAPGRRHITGCTYPFPAPVPVSDEAEAAWEEWALHQLRFNLDDQRPAFLAGFRAARLAGKDDER